MRDIARRDALDRKNVALHTYGLVKQHAGEYRRAGFADLEAHFMAEAHVAGSQGVSFAEVDKLVNEATRGEL